jgi:integrase
VAVGHRAVDTYIEAEIQALLKTIANGRISHAWELALCGLRRGEIAGLRWGDVDLERETLSITNNRVDAAGKAIENGPKSAMSRRTLPLPDRLVSVLKAAKKRQVAERLALGGGSWEYVVCNEAGDPYHPQVLSRYWQDAVKAPGCARSSCTPHGTPRPRQCTWTGAGRGDRGVDRAQGCVADNAALCALPRRRIEGCR